MYNPKLAWLWPAPKMAIITTLQIAFDPHTSVNKLPNTPAWNCSAFCGHIYFRTCCSLMVGLQFCRVLECAHVSSHVLHVRHVPQLLSGSSLCVTFRNDRVYGLATPGQLVGLGLLSVSERRCLASFLVSSSSRLIRPTWKPNKSLKADMHIMLLLWT